MDRHILDQLGNVRRQLRDQPGPLLLTGAIWPLGTGLRLFVSRAVFGLKATPNGKQGYPQEFGCPQANWVVEFAPSPEARVERSA